MATKEEILDSISGMTVLELSELLKDVRGAVRRDRRRPGGAWPPPVAVGAEAPAEEEKDEFDVVLTAAGDQKIAVIKEVRVAHQPRPEGGQGPGRVRPQAVLEKANKEDAEKAKAALEGAGATVELK